LLNTGESYQISPGDGGHGRLLIRYLEGDSCSLELAVSLLKLESAPIVLAKSSGAYVMQRIFVSVKKFSVLFLYFWELKQLFCAY
jgi:hypothetical protein